MEFYPESKEIEAVQTRFNSQWDGILRKTAPPLKTATNSFNSQRDGILLTRTVLMRLLSGFQFPAGWNSTPHITSSRNSKASFNSQRDGILRNDIRFSAIRHRFQFPTGWNSTLAFQTLAFADSLFQFPAGWNSTVYRRNRRARCLVSIPSGMEFYTSLCFLAFAFGRFNSQRDGILFNFSLKLGVFFFVSIPSGMEFYLTQRFQSFASVCFNSQRDGILRHISPAAEILKRVSIPNGMEFYDRKFRIVATKYSKFQFPTGWNSTQFFR